MINTKLLAYAAYTKTDIEWIGTTPSHWQLTRNKDFFDERGSLSLSGDETLLTVSHITGVTRRSEKNVNMFMAETMEGYMDFTRFSRHIIMSQLKWRKLNEGYQIYSRI